MSTPYNSDLNMNMNQIPQMNFNSTPFQQQAYGACGLESPSIENIQRLHVNIPDDMEKVERKSDDVVAVVVTICSGSSYDALYRVVPQISPEGIVAVYQMSHGYTEKVLDKLNDEQEVTSESNELLELITNIKSVEPESVVFNWECCSACSDKGFSTTGTICLMAKLLGSGYMVMCSDFAVKALISEWDVELLGPNPFIKTGEFGGSFEIAFDPATLLASPSEQMKKLGELCDDGTAKLHAMSGTIAFTFDEEIVKNTNEYEFSLLTISTKLGNQVASSFAKESELVSIGDKRGLVGHAVLAFPSGGLLFVSSGHWIELSKINSSEEAVLRVAKSMYGEGYSAQWSANLQSAKSEDEKRNMLNTYSAQMIQNCTPAKFSYSKKQC